MLHTDLNGKVTPFNVTPDLFSLHLLDQMETSMNIFTLQRCLWSADWGNMQRDTHSFLQPRVCVPVHNYILMKCTHRSRQMNDTDSRNCSLHKVLHLCLQLFSSISWQKNSHVFGPYTLCISLNCYSLLPLSSLLLFTPLYFSLFVSSHPFSKTQPRSSIFSSPPPPSPRPLFLKAVVTAQPLSLQLQGQFPSNCKMHPPPPKVPVGLNQSTPSLYQQECWL